MTKLHESLEHDMMLLKEVAEDMAQQKLAIPFSTAAKTVEVKQVNTTRIFEALIIAAITSVAVYIVSIPRLEERMQNLKESVDEVKTDIKQIKADIYIPSTKASGQASRVPAAGLYYPMPSKDITPEQ